LTLDKLSDPLFSMIDITSIVNQTTAAANEEIHSHVVSFAEAALGHFPSAVEIEIVRKLMQVGSRIAIYHFSSKVSEELKK